jgi:hypothetical protein
MMVNTTARWALPLLHAGQAQKELDHNEALALIDLALHACVEAIGVDVPPSAPVDGQCWIVGAEPVGDWAGQALALAGWTAGGWRFVGPRDGMVVACREGGVIARFGNGEWVAGAVHTTGVFVGGTRVLTTQQPAIADATNGTNVDSAARATLSLVLEALRSHGLIAR